MLRREEEELEEERKRGKNEFSEKERTINKIMLEKTQLKEGSEVDEEEDKKKSSSLIDKLKV